MNRRKEDPDTASLAVLAADIRVLIGQLRRRMREQAHPGDFTWTQKSVLLHLEREGSATVSALARIEGVRPQSMGATIAVLEAAGLVGSAPDPSDGRQTILSLTAACREKFKAGRAAREDWLLRAIQTKFAPAERQQLAAAVELLKRLVDT